MTTELAHFDAAKREIALASSIDEVKQIRDKAEALRQYIRQQGATLEMQNHCAEIKIRAERKAGEMLGETEKQGPGQYQQLHDVTAAVPPSLADLGISRIQSHRWQQEASIPEERFERHVAEVKARGDELTSKGILELANVHVSNNSGESEWYTPSVYIEAARDVMGSIDVDPASSDKANKTVGASVYYTAETDGLDKDWNGNVWLNPPYAQPLIEMFCAALADKYDSGEVKQACVLVNNATETTWGQRLLRSCSAVCFPKGRIRFLDSDGNPGAPLQGQAILYFGDNADRFVYVFGTFGATSKWYSAER